MDAVKKVKNDDTSSVIFCRCVSLECQLIVSHNICLLTILLFCEQLPGNFSWWVIYFNHLKWSVSYFSVLSLHHSYNSDIVGVINWVWKLQHILLKWAQSRNVVLQLWSKSVVKEVFIRSLITFLITFHSLAVFRVDSNPLQKAIFGACHQIMDHPIFHL